MTDLTDSKTAARNARILEQYIRDNDLPGQLRTPDENGTVKYENLPQGLYLIVSNVDPVEFNAFLAPIPTVIKADGLALGKGVIIAMTREEAIAAALSAANLTEDDILYIWAEYEIDDGVPEYEVEFRTTDTEYDYTIHAETGAILSWDQEAEHAAQMTATNPTATTPLTEAEAITIVLTHAKLSEADVTHLHVEYDRDDNNFEVEFYCNRMEYNYEIDAATGTILDYEIDD